MKTIYTSYYACRKLNENHNKIAISRSVPYKKNLTIMKDIALPYYILNRYKYDGLPYEEFNKEYRKYLETIDLDNVLNTLKDGDVLLCYEKDRSVCHRAILGDVLMEKYPSEIIVKEL